MITRLLSYLFCLYLTLSIPLAYAIDPITGAWTANAAASAAFGGGVSGGAAALTAAVQAAAGAAATAATAAAAAAAVAGAGVAAFCAASYLQGANSCASGPIGGGLSGGQIFVGPNGDLILKGEPYYIAPPNTSQFKTATSACLSEIARGSNANSPNSYIFKSAQITYNAGGAITGAICHYRFNYATTPDRNYDGEGRWVSYVVTSPDRPATDEEIGVAVGSNPAAAAAAAAATAAPNIAAANAAAAAATAAPRTPEAECAAKGMKHGTFNGAVFCVGVGAGVDGTGATAGETGTDAGAGTGTGTSNPPNTGTSNPPVSPPMPAFCTYAQSLCEWLNWTKAEATFDTNTKPVIAEADDSISPSDYQRRYFEFGNACPPAHTIPISFMGASQTIQLSYDPLCMMAQKMRPVIILVAWIVGARIVVGSPAKGES